MSTDLRAPSRLKSRIYSVLMERQRQDGPLLSLSGVKAGGRNLCVFEELVQIAPVGQAAQLLHCSAPHRAEEREFRLFAAVAGQHGYLEIRQHTLRTQICGRCAGCGDRREGDDSEDQHYRQLSCDLHTSWRIASRCDSDRLRVTQADRRGASVGH